MNNEGWGVCVWSGLVSATKCFMHMHKTVYLCLASAIKQKRTQFFFGACSEKMWLSLGSGFRSGTNRSCLQWRSSSMSGSYLRVKGRWSVRLPGGSFQPPQLYSQRTRALRWIKSWGKADAHNALLRPYSHSHQ